MMINAVGMPSRADGKTGGGWTSPNSRGRSGQSPVTTRASSNHMARPTTMANSMSRPTFALPRTNAATRRMAAHTVGMSAKSSHMPISASGKASKNLVTALEIPGSGIATSPTSTMPTNETISKMRSVARRDRG